MDDPIATYPLMNATGDGFHFRQFRHSSILGSRDRGALALAL
jgi:hypothetical protein